MEEVKEFRSFLKTVKGNEGDRCHYPTRLDLYGCGCQHDCSYCYAKSLLDFRKLWNPSHPSVANFLKVKRAIARNFKEGDVVRLGGMTDCFQPIERRHRMTMEAIRELNKRNVHYLIVTKSDMVADDEYMSLMRKDLAHIQITITTTDDELCKTYEKAVPPSRRIKAVEKLQENGFDVAVRLSPYIPQYVDTDKLNSIKCDKIIVEFLRVNTWIRKWFDIDYSKYTLNNAGYKHLPLEEKKKLIENIKFKEISVCEDVDDHWEYWQKNINHNQKDCGNLNIKING